MPQHNSVYMVNGDGPLCKDCAQNAIYLNLRDAGFASGTKGSFDPLWDFADVLLMGAATWAGLHVQERPHTEVEQDECVACDEVFAEECYECQKEDSDD